MIRTAIADDQPLVRAGLRSIFEHAGDITVVAEAGDGLAAVEMARMERIGAFADVLVTHGRSPDTPVAVIADGTLHSQRTVRSTLADVAVAAAGIRPPAIVVIGPVVALRAPRV